MRQFKLQIEAAIGVALPSWHFLSGQLSRKPITKHQFCCRSLNRQIEDQWSKINSIAYKLSSPDAMPHTQQAQKHPTSALKRIETLNS